MIRVGQGGCCWFLSGNKNDRAKLNIKNLLVVAEGHILKIEISLLVKKSFIIYLENIGASVLVDVDGS